MIGLNEGNGHPFSYSALFNGYDPVELQKRCPFQLIKEYLPKEHRNEVFINGAKVTHIWTQDPKLSEDVAKVSKIPHVVSKLEDLTGKVDAVILARDDPWKHWEMAQPFLFKRIPIFIDKQLASTKSEMDNILKYAGPDYPLMAGSSMRFTRELAEAKKKNLSTVKSVHGMSRVSWMRYGHHLFEGVAALWGLDIEWVRSLSEKDGHDIVQIQYSSGLNVILEFITDAALPIQFTCFSDNQPAFTVPFQDFFHSFREMMSRFVSFVQGGERPFPYEEMVGIAHVVLAGDLSKKQGGIKIIPRTLHAA